MRRMPTMDKAVRPISEANGIGDGVCDDTRKKNIGPTGYGIIDLFAGIGGVSAGFRNTGHFDVIALVDIDQDCKETYKANYPNSVYMKRDISKLSRCHLLRVAQGREIDGIVGCPPCQGFSAAGERDPTNPLNGLVVDYFRIVKAVRPRFLVLENVPGILAQDSFGSLLREVESIGYRSWSGVLNAALYGVPQTRQRAIVIGYRQDLDVVPVPPEPTHFGLRQVFDYSTKKLVNLDDPQPVNALGACPASERIHLKGFGQVPWLAYDDLALASLRLLPSLVTTEEAFRGLPMPTIRGERECVNAHVAWGHTFDLLERLRQMPQGGNLADIADLGAAADPELWLRGRFPDVFDPAWKAAVDKAAAERFSPLRNDPWLLGYFDDNELRWGADWRSKDSLLETFLKMPDSAPGHHRAAAFIAAQGGDPANFADAEKSAFQGLVAHEYFRICHDAIRAHDPNHLILGCRFAGCAPDPVLHAMRSYVDVVSYNNYSHQAPVAMLEHIHALTGRPVMVTEFSFKAMDSGLPNAKGGGSPVATQEDRASLFEAYVGAIARLPYCLGYHWFEYADEPKEGRFDGENCNYGLVKIDDTPWELLTHRIQAVNSTLEQAR